MQVRKQKFYKQVLQPIAQAAASSEAEVSAQRAPAAAPTSNTGPTREGSAINLFSQHMTVQTNIPAPAARLQPRARLGLSVEHH